MKPLFIKGIALTASAALFASLIIGIYAVTQLPTPYLYTWLGLNILWIVIGAGLVSVMLDEQ
jgi:hypothetical protein